MQAYTRLYLQPNDVCLPRLTAPVFFDVCYTELAPGVLRITAVLANWTSRGKVQRRRLYRANVPEVWDKVRQALYDGHNVVYHSNAANAHKLLSA